MTDRDIADLKLHLLAILTAIPAMESRISELERRVATLEMARRTDIATRIKTWTELLKLISIIRTVSPTMRWLLNWILVYSVSWIGKMLHRLPDFWPF